MTRRQLDEHARRRQEAVDRAIQAMRRASRELAQSIYDDFVAEMTRFVEAGRLAGNAALINASPAWRKYYRDAAKVGTAILDGIREVAETVKEYFAELLGVPTSDFDRVSERLITALGYDGKAFVRGGALYNIMFDTSAERRVKGLAIQAIRAGKSLADFQKDLKVILRGDQAAGRAGAIEAHYMTNAGTAYSEFERAMSNEVAEKNDLNNAIWSGPVLDDTRPFCAAKKGKVFTREQITAMDKQKWIGKIPGQSTIISQGGYGCVDTLLWITDLLAAELRLAGRGG